MNAQQVADLDHCLAMLRAIVAKHPRGFSGTLAGYKGYNQTEPARVPTPLELRTDAERCTKMASALLIAAEGTDDDEHAQQDPRQARD